MLFYVNALTRRTSVFLTVIAFATIRVLRAAGRPRPEQRVATAALVALVVLSMLDHYLWTMPPGRVIGWLPLALLAATPPVCVSAEPPPPAR